ncbi:MAG: NAD(P)-dependent oxidoreductase, partial [Alphaproteobacteria bacterium]|nr:NAD(P)-dependent oxidoreductase [Alphaproteobacteria bacterium]
CFLGEGGVVQHIRPGSLVIDSSTIDPATTDRLAAELAAAGVAFVDAPVGRSPIQAAEGTLLFMIGAEAADLARARPLLDAMGSDIVHCGGVGSGIRTKLVNNLLSQATCQLSAEAVALGLKMGLSLETLLPVMTGGLGSNGFLSGYWPAKVLAGDTEPGFAIRLSAKDLGLAVAMAEAAGAPIPTGTAAAEAVARAAESDGDLDVSGLLTLACAAAGTKLPEK